MRSKSKSAIEQKFHDDVVLFAQDSEWLREKFGHVVSHPYQFQLDHIIGAQAKRKISFISMKVGEFAVMPIPIELHDITSNHPMNRTLRPGAFREHFGHEKCLWAGFIDAMVEHGFELPFGGEVINSILNK